MSVRDQIRPMLTLALPLILAELGWMSMGIIDTMMVGHMDRPVLAIASSALGQVLYNTIAFGMAGVLLGLDTYLSQSQGAGRFDEAGRWPAAWAGFGARAGGDAGGADRGGSHGADAAAVRP